MAVTRAQIRRRAVHLVPEKGFASADGVNSLTATAGAVGTLTDTAALPPTGAAATLFTNQWLWRPAAANAEDLYRLIPSTGYTASTRLITHSGPDWTVAPLASGDTGVYLLTRDDPRLWNRAINEALRTECFFVRRDEFSPTSNTLLVYALTAAPITVTDLSYPLTQIHGLEWHNESEATGEERWHDWANGIRTWDVLEDAGAYSLVLNSPFDSTMQMRLVSTVPYATLTDETTTSNVDEEWAAWATLLVMSRWLGANDQEWRHIGATALSFVRDRRRQLLGRYAFRTVGRESEYGGAISVAGRGGRGRSGVNRRTYH